MRMAGTVIIKAADKLIARGKRLAAIILDSREETITFTGGVFTAVGSNANINIFKKIAIHVLLMNFHPVYITFDSVNFPVMGQSSKRLS